MISKESLTYPTKSKREKRLKEDGNKVIAKAKMEVNNKRCPSTLQEEKERREEKRRENDPDSRNTNPNLPQTKSSAIPKSFTNPPTKESPSNLTFRLINSPLKSKKYTPHSQADSKKSQHYPPHPPTHTQKHPQTDTGNSDQS